MEDMLTLDNILSSDDIDNLFTEELEEVVEKDDDDNSDEQSSKKNDNQEATEVNPKELFSDVPESVSSEEKRQEREDTPSNKASSSHKKNFYSSIAKALKDEGVFPDLEEDSCLSANDPDSFKDLIEKQIQAGLTERQKLIEKALRGGAEPSEMNKYESYINYLDSLGEEQLKDESDAGEDLRKKLIYNDLKLRGYGDEKAIKEIQKSFNAGSDVEDALDALESVKKYYSEQYQNLINEKIKIDEDKKKAYQKSIEENKDFILNSKELFGDVVIDKKTRQQIIKNLYTPSYKDEETGYSYNVVQKYEKDHPGYLMRMCSTIYTLTDGFKNFDNLFSGKVRKEVKNSIKELENVLSSTGQTIDGNLSFVTGVDDDPESYIGEGWKL